MGDRILLHTSDGGRVWREVPRTEHYATPPSVAFINPMTGWIETDTDLGESILFETRDGGKSWADVTGEFPVLPTVLDATHWWGIESTSHANSPDGRFLTRTLVRTADGGNTWSRFAIPYDAGEFPLVKFLSADVGWAGTVADGQIVFFRTTDGGKTWEKSVTVTQKRGTQLRDLFFLNKDRGWLIVDYNLKEGFNGNGTYVLATNDGGKTWTAQTSDVLQNAFAWHVSFLSERLGFLFVTAPISSRDSAEMTPAILYTQDLGLHWHKVNVANEVSACQALDGDLLCGANTKGSQPGLLRIHPR
jgi:photosystem II stability/assembly factor-like uncharacterized protein